MFEAPSGILRLFNNRIEDMLLAIAFMRQELLLLQYAHKRLDRSIGRFGVIGQPIYHILHAAVAQFPDDIHHLLFSF